MKGKLWVGNAKGELVALRRLGEVERRIPFERSFVFPPLLLHQRGELLVFTYGGIFLFGEEKRFLLSSLFLPKSPPLLLGDRVVWVSWDQKLEVRRLPHLSLEFVTELSEMPKALQRGEKDAVYLLGERHLYLWKKGEKRLLQKPLSDPPLALYPKGLVAVKRKIFIPMPSPRFVTLPGDLFVLRYPHCLVKKEDKVLLFHIPLQKVLWQVHSSLLKTPFWFQVSGSLLFTATSQGEVSAWYWKSP